MARTRKQDGSEYPSKTCCWQAYWGTCTLKTPVAVTSWIQPQVWLTHFTTVSTCFESFVKVGLSLTARVLKRLWREKKHTCGRKDCWGLTAPGLAQCSLFLEWKKWKTFFLRGGEEHRSLRPSQIKRCSVPDHYVYTENSSRIVVVVWLKREWLCTK